MGTVTSARRELAAAVAGCVLAGGLALSAGDYATLTARLCELVPPGRRLAFLEGGYDLDALSRSVTATVRGAYEDPPGWEYAGGVRPVDESRAALAPFWKGLR